MDVEFDPAKDQENQRKHGISLKLAAAFDEESAWFDVDDSQDYGELRFNAVGWIGGLLYTLTFTTRGEVVRAISLRGATREEHRRYDKEFDRA